MNTRIPAELKDIMADVIYTYDESFLMNIMAMRIEFTQCNSVPEYVDLMMNDEEEQKIFRSSLTVNYTGFFRNPVAFAYLKSIILPHLILDKINHNKKLIRIWAAGCSTGQEAYSLAFLLSDLEPVISRPFSWMIFATDNQPENLRKAEAALYSDDEMENLTLGHARKYFTKEKSDHRVIRKINERINFSHSDLLNSSNSTPVSAIFGNFDVIICANLMMHYSATIRNRIQHTLFRALDDNGYLIIGESEHDRIINDSFQEVYPQSFIFRKIQKL